MSEENFSQMGQTFGTNRPKKSPEAWRERETKGFSCDEERWYSMWTYGQIGWDEYQVATAVSIADKPHLYRPSVFLDLSQDAKQYLERRLLSGAQYDETCAKYLCAWLVSHSNCILDDLEKIKTLKHARSKLTLIDDRYRMDRVDLLISTLENSAREIESKFLNKWSDAKKVIRKDSSEK